MVANTFYVLPQYLATRTAGDNPKFLWILLPKIKLLMFCRGMCFPRR